MYGLPHPDGLFDNMWDRQLEQLVAADLKVRAWPL